MANSSQVANPRVTLNRRLQHRDSGRGLPGTVYDQPDRVRIGSGRANMPDALELLEANLTESH
jgi:hypothetical protein